MVYSVAVSRHNVYTFSSNYILYIHVEVVEVIYCVIVYLKIK